MPTHNLTRAAVLRRGAGGGLALACVATPLAVFPAVAGAAAPDSDLAYLRLLVGAELLAADFYSRALDGHELPPAVRRELRRMLNDEKAHWHQLSDLMTASGQTAATAADIDFTYPKNTFSSAQTILRQATNIEDLAIGAYVGSLEAVTTPELRLPLARIVVNEGQHCAAIARRRGGPEIGPTLATALTIDDVSAALDRYES